MPALSQRRLLHASKTCLLSRALRGARPIAFRIRSAVGALSPHK